MSAPSISELGIHALGAITRMRELVTNDDECRHYVRQMRNMAENALQNAFNDVLRMEDLSIQMVKEEREKQEVKT